MAALHLIVRLVAAVAAGAALGRRLAGGLAVRQARL